MNDTSRRFALRDRTSSLHASLDQRVGTFGDRSDYARYLRGIAAFRFRIEPAISATAWPAGWGDWRPLSISALIGRDLQDLGLEVTASEPQDGAWSESALLGTLYVLEGSALGAMLLFRHAQALGLDADFGARHLAHLSGDATRWRRFLEILDDAEPFDIDVAAEASLATFRAAGTAFESVA